MCAQALFTRWSGDFISAGMSLGESMVGFGRKMGVTLNKCWDEFGTHLQWKSVGLGRD